MATSSRIDRKSTFNSVDDVMLSKPLAMSENGQSDSAAARSGFLREQQRNVPVARESDGTDEAPLSLREAVLRKKREKNVKAKKEEDEGNISSAAASPIRKSTSKLLQQAWINIPDSLGLTILWIDIHVWLGAIFGHNFFCKIGQEWVDSNIVAAENEYAKKSGQMLGTVEPMVLAGLNFGCLVVIIFIAAVIYMIVDGNSILTGLKGALGALWGLLSGGN